MPTNWATQEPQKTEFLNPSENQVPLWITIEIEIKILKSFFETDIPIINYRHSIEEKIDSSFKTIDLPNIYIWQKNPVFKKSNLLQGEVISECFGVKEKNKVYKGKFYSISK